MKNSNKVVVVVGLGEVGKPLFELASQYYSHAVGVDVSPSKDLPKKVDFLHVCYPFQIKDFVGETVRYIGLFKPALTIVNSTVAIGTTRTIAELSRAAVVNSPVRGKHARMLEELKSYTKFIGSIAHQDGQMAAEHFRSMGLETKVLSSPEASELAKLTETSYFGLIIAWAQEVERYCDKTKQSYDEVASFWDEIKFFPSVRYFPGVIGGHCVMPNIEILSRFEDSCLLRAIQDSNSKKIERDKQLTQGREHRKRA